MEERRGGEGARCLQRAVQMASSPSSKTQTGGMGARDVGHAHSQALDDDVLVHRYTRSRAQAETRFMHSDNMQSISF